MPVYKPHDFDIATYTLAFSVIAPTVWCVLVSTNIIQQGRQPRSSRYGQVHRQSLQERTFHL